MTNTKFTSLKILLILVNIATICKLCKRFLSLLDPKAHRWTYIIARHPLSVVRPTVACQHFQTTSPLKLTKFHISHIIYRPWERGGVARRGRIMPFYPNRIRTLVAVLTCSCHWLIMGKMKNDLYCFYCYLTAGILTNVLQEYSFSSPLQNIIFVQTSEFQCLPWQPKLLNLWKDLMKSSPQKP